MWAFPLAGTLQRRLSLLGRVLVAWTLDYLLSSISLSVSYRRRAAPHPTAAR